MKLAIFSTQAYDVQYFEHIHATKFTSKFDITFHPIRLTADTALLAKDATAVCVFVNDALGPDLLRLLHGYGVRAVLLRCCGYNGVDLKAAEDLGMLVANVPGYSPESIAEFAVAQIQTLNRKTHRAFNRVREGNFSLNGLVGFALYGRTVGLVGTGRIGVACARILHGFGCRLLAYDPYPSEAFKQYGEFTDLDTLLSQSDIVSLHCPLMPSTKHIVNEKFLNTMKKGAMLVNTSRGGLIETEAVIAALKTKQLGSLALDVYEGEESLFYGDHSGEVIGDDLLMRLLTFPNALVCGHQAFLTEESLQEIAETTLQTMDDFVEGRPCQHALTKVPVKS
ncbi:lactate dehydrogenase [Lentithecium fluviatile CBS 122367]|uniref:Lactate dehydrogenase n=1 Tax=Lentithecium fluviatile CBS 122367 TaxID=1168545 RepID=A0A6G1IWA6_9PLEO|nr:lactate dehydrogenase [Lentithecium fluviatile CBS 122367]